MLKMMMQRDKGICLFLGRCRDPGPDSFCLPTSACQEESWGVREYHGLPDCPRDAMGKSIVYQPCTSREYGESVKAGPE